MNSLQTFGTLTAPMTPPSMSQTNSDNGIDRSDLPVVLSTLISPALLSILSSVPSERVVLVDSGEIGDSTDLLDGEIFVDNGSLDIVQVGDCKLRKSGTKLTL
jgi:hypothetical protein